ncbi:hypothetical protein OHT76_27090 [Streptomyces sp. NBC_00287]|uniref:hypothetical protein n=1 Tax=Streptomyces sp. NBC_00287 TaxID=2975702 RepID=UPI002E2B5C6E|nr:hypothetical protein [Streptomyces sp. NBC_00287]
MAGQASFPHPTAQRVLVALATAGAALGAAAPLAVADAEPVLDNVIRTRPTSLGKIDPQAGLQGITSTLGYVTGPVAGLKPNPLAGTGVDPLDNGVGTQLADFQPLTSQMLTGPVAQAQSIGSIPVIGQAASLLNNG